MAQQQAVLEAESQRAQRAEQAVTSAQRELSQRGERCAALERELARVSADFSGQLEAERERLAAAERGWDAALAAAKADADRLASVHAEEVQQIRAAAAAEREETIAAKERALEQVHCP